MGAAYVYGWIVANTAAQIESVVATYGGNLGGAPGNATNTIDNVFPSEGPSLVLTGLASEPYPINPTFLGDPYPGQSKDFVLSWTCGRYSAINGVSISRRPRTDNPRSPPRARRR